jgi:hypothetical protein
MRSTALRIVAPALLVALLPELAPQAATAATYTIATLLEDDTVNGNCTLREALLAASTDTTHDACPGDVGPDTIVLDLIGTYVLQSGDIASSGRQLTVRGNPAQAATAYLVDLGGAQRFLEVIGDSTLTLENLSLGNGLHATYGGALLAENSNLTLRKVRILDSDANYGGGVAFRTLSAPHQLEVLESTFSGNVATGDQAAGGGLYLDLQVGGVVRVLASRFLDNRVVSSAGNFSRSGGGLALQAFDDAAIELRHLLFQDNLIDAPGNASGAGLAVYATNSTSGSFELQDATFRGNDFANLAGTNSSTGIGLDLDSPSMTVRRIGLYGNLGDPGRSQATIQARDGAQAFVSDIVAFGGAGAGLTLATSSAASTLVAGNLTVAGNPDTGLTLLENAGSLTLENSVLFGNATSSGSNLSLASGTPAVASENLIGIDPLFVNAAGGDLRLTSGSPAVNAGDMLAFSVGPFDLGHGDRVIGPEIDLGAFERGALFSDGFEFGELYAWTSAVP